MTFSIHHICFTSARDPGTPGTLPFFPNFHGQSIIFLTVSIMPAVVESVYYDRKCILWSYIITPFS